MKHLPYLLNAGNPDHRVHEFWIPQEISTQDEESDAKNPATVLEALVFTGRTPSTVCPRSSDPFYILTCYMKWVTTSWTHSIFRPEHPKSVLFYEQSSYMMLAVLHTVRHSFRGLTVFFLWPKNWQCILHRSFDNIPKICF